MRKWKTKSGFEIFQLLNGRSNVFLLTNGTNNILIDTSVSRLWGRLQKQLQKLKIDNVDLLVLTHSHFDHAANANRIKEKFNSSVIIHKDEAEYLQRGDFIPPKGTTFLTKIIVNTLSKFISSSIFQYELCVPDIIFDSTYDLKELGFNAYLTHTPGHTVGSISLIVDDEIAITGDTLFGVFKGSILPPYAQNIDLLIKSWGKLLKTNCLYFLPSHGTVKHRRIVQKCYKQKLRAAANGINVLIHSKIKCY